MDPSQPGAGRAEEPGTKSPCRHELGGDFLRHRSLASSPVPGRVSLLLVMTRTTNATLLPLCYGSPSPFPWSRSLYRYSALDSLRIGPSRAQENISSFFFPVHSLLFFLVIDPTGACSRRGCRILPQNLILQNLGPPCAQDRVEGNWPHDREQEGPSLVVEAM